MEKSATGWVKHGSEKSVDGEVKANSHQLRITPQPFEKHPAVAQPQSDVEFRSGNDQTVESSLSGRSEGPGRRFGHDLIQNQVEDCLPGSKHPKECTAQ
jgi:hypothetical protein